MTRPKIPIYPRPVSPLTAEPLRANPSDIHLDDSSDSHSDGEQRAAKRRRIEKLGEQYLRGDGLFIMTAGLRGPLIGWVNPWSKKSGQRMATRAGMLRQNSREEVPETALTVPARGKNVVPVKSRNRDIAREPSLQGKVSKGTSDGGENWLKTVEGYNRYTCSARDDSPTPLHKHDEVRNPHHLMSSKKLQYFTSKPQAATTHPRFPDAILRQPTQDETLGPTPTVLPDTEQDSRAEINPPKRPQSPQSDVPTTLSTTNVPTVQPDPAFMEQRDVRTTKPAGEDKTLKYDWKSKRRSVHKLPPSTYLPEFEYRPVAEPLKSLEKLQEEQTKPSRSLDVKKKPQCLAFASSADMPIAQYQSSTNRQADSEKQAGCPTKQCDGSTLKVATEPVTLENLIESASMPPRKMPPPSLSTQTSTTTTTNAMPSAQVVPAVQPLLAESYPSTAGKLIEPEVTPADNKVSGNHSPSAKSSESMTNEQHEPRVVTLSKSTMLDANGTNPKHTDNMQRPCSREGIVPFGAFKSPPAHTAVTEPDTQQMLAAITPLGFSTIKKVPLKSINKPTPATATRAKPVKQKKRASFIAPHTADKISSGSSQGSIKGALKVSKMVHGETKIVEGPERLSQHSLFGKLGLDMETSDEDGGPGEAENFLGLSSLLRSDPHPQGAPVSSGPMPTANTMTSTGSAQQQDAQQELGRRQGDGQKAGDGQDDFNLASAMDDLGSFLGTWDTDKEAREFAGVISSSCVKSALKSKSSTASIRR
jgi:hypothetical protein